MLKDLDHISKASDWISDGDLVDRMIHGYVFAFSINSRMSSHT